MNIPIYEDLLPHLDKDPDYSREAFVPNLLNAMVSDGSLYYIPFDFYITSFTAPESVAGDRTSITMKEAERLANDLGPDTTVFPSWLTRENLLAYIVSFSRAKFTDPSAGGYNFFDPEFIELLERCKTHPEPPSDGAYGASLLSYSLLQTFEAFQGLRFAYGDGGGYSFVGFPTQEGCGSTFNINMRLSISSTSRHKDAAWEFVRMAISDETQENVSFFPVIQAALDKRTEAALEGDPDLTKIKLEQFEADKFNRLLGSITMLSPGTDSTIYKIISDEAAPFFAGEKTAEEAAKIIQSRINVYVSE